MQRYDKKSVTRITFYYNFISKASKKCDGNHSSLIPSNESAVPEHIQNTFYKSKKKGCFYVNKRYKTWCCQKFYLPLDL